jgi:hypothetical protein
MVNRNENLSSSRTGAMVQYFHTLHKNPAIATVRYNPAIDTGSELSSGSGTRQDAVEADLVARSDGIGSRRHPC